MLYRDDVEYLVLVYYQQEFYSYHGLGPLYYHLREVLLVQMNIHHLGGLALLLYFCGIVYPSRVHRLLFPSYETPVAYMVVRLGDSGTR